MNKEKLRVGDWVEVLSKDEILQTLDRDGRLDGMPFMPEMFAFCGRRFQVYKSAHKTCDTVFPVRSRRLTDTIHLQTRCDGRAHGGCQAGCLIFWKEAWLKRIDANLEDKGSSGELPQKSYVNGRAPKNALEPVKGCTEEDVVRAACPPENGDKSDPTYVCQATRLPYASEDLSPYDFRQYLEDYTSGNVSLAKWIRGIIYITYQNVIDLGIGVGAPMRWLYDRFQSLWGGLPYPRWQGKIPLGQPTPAASLDLKEGEWVRVKSYQEILATCSVDNKNRGMGFDGEQMPYCGGTYRVHKRVNKIINEKTGKMMQMKNPCIILENVFCEGRYSGCRMFCARSIYSYWREIWLERVSPGPEGPLPKSGISRGVKTNGRGDPASGSPFIAEDRAESLSGSRNSPAQR